MIVASIVAIALTAFLILHFSGSKENLKAEIYFRNEIVEVVDLTKEDSERHIKVKGLHGDVIIAVKKNAVAVIDSNCPEKHCIKTGWVNISNRSIICAYNAVYVLTTGGEPDFDIEV